MLTVKKDYFRKLGDNALVWSVDGKDLYFTEATPEEAEKLDEGEVIVLHDKIYICKESLNEWIKYDEHLCVKCRCETFLRCAKVMGRDTKGIQNHTSFVKEGFEKRGTDNEQCIIIKCANYEPERKRENNPSKRLGLVKNAYEIWVDSQKSENYGLKGRNTWTN